MSVWRYVLAMKIRRFARIAAAEILSSAALSPACLGPVLIDASVCRAVLERIAEERATRHRLMREPPPGHPDRTVSGVPVSADERWFEAELRRRQRRRAMAPRKGMPR